MFNISDYIEQAEIVGYKLRISISDNASWLECKLTSDTLISATTFWFEEMRLAKTDIIQIWLSKAIEEMLNNG